MLQNPTVVKPRYALFDGLRGATMLSMVLYHFSYDLFVIAKNHSQWPTLPAVHLWQQSICCTFILLAGFCWHWGRARSLRRGLLVNACGLLITLITWLFMPGQLVVFGVLNFIGCAILLTIPMHRLLDKIPCGAGIAVTALLFCFTKTIQWGSVGLFSWQIKVPGQLYTPLLTIFGFPAPGFWSSDFFPVMPWIFLFWLGYFLNCAFRKYTGHCEWAMVRLPGFSRLGHWSLPVYMLHQPLCFAAAMALAKFLR